MGIRGNKPKPTILHLVDGTMNVTRHKGREGEPRPDGRPIRPKKLLKRQAELWAEYVDTAFWLTKHDGPKALVWVCLQAEFEKDPAGMIPARIGQLRAVGSELGLDPASRARMGGSGSSKPKSKEDEFFD